MSEELKEVKVAKVEKKNHIDYLKHISLVYPLLILIGYLNYDFYYKFFDIEIFKYLSFNEFLFSFISFIYPIIFYFCVMSSMFVFLWLLDSNVFNINYFSNTESEFRKFLYDPLTSYKPIKSNLKWYVMIFIYGGYSL